MLSDNKFDLYANIDSHICNDEKPSLYLQSLTGDLFMNEEPFAMLSCLKKIKQSPKYHPEGSVWNHTMLVLDEVAKRKSKASDSRAFMWAALLHDIGKAVTTSKNKKNITAYNHDIVGADLTYVFLSEFELDKVFINFVTALVRWHMQILYVTKDLPQADIKSMKKQVPTNDIALLGLCDRLGRGNVDIRREMENISIFRSKVK